MATESELLEFRATLPVPGRICNLPYQVHILPCVMSWRKLISQEVTHGPGATTIMVVVSCSSGLKHEEWWKNTSSRVVSTMKKY
jgi:hypothetical protein